MKFLGYWGLITKPSNVLLQIVNRVIRKMLWGEKRHKLTAKDLTRIKRDATRNHYLPVLSYSRDANYLEFHKYKMLRDTAKVRKDET